MFGKKQKPIDKLVKYITYSKPYRFEKMEKLLLSLEATSKEKGINLANTPLPDGKTPVTLAASRNDLRAIEVLAQHGGNITSPDNSGRTPLQYSMGNKEIANFIINNPNFNPMSEVRVYVQLLPDILLPSTEVSDYLISNHQLRKLIDIPALNGDTLLHKYVRERNYNVVEKLLEYGANPNISNNEGETPLDICDKNLKYEKISDLKYYLIMAKKIYKTEDFSFLDVAMRSEHNNFISNIGWIDKVFDLVNSQIPDKNGTLLPQYKKSSDASKSDGQTLLHYAAISGNYSLIPFLLVKHLDPHKLDSDGKEFFEYLPHKINVPADILKVISIDFNSGRKKALGEPGGKIEFLESLYRKKFGEDAESTNTVKKDNYYAPFVTHACNYLLSHNPQNKNILHIAAEVSRHDIVNTNWDTVKNKWQKDDFGCEFYEYLKGYPQDFSQVNNFYDSNKQLNSEIADKVVLKTLKNLDLKLIPAGIESMDFLNNIKSKIECLKTLEPKVNSPEEKEELLVMKSQTAREWFLFHTKNSRGKSCFTVSDDYVPLGIASPATLSEYFASFGLANLSKTLSRDNATEFRDQLVDFAIGSMKGYGLLESPKISFHGADTFKKCIDIDVLQNFIKNSTTEDISYRLAFLESMGKKLTEAQKDYGNNIFKFYIDMLKELLLDCRNGGISEKDSQNVVNFCLENLQKKLSYDFSAYRELLENRLEKSNRKEDPANPNFLRETIMLFRSCNSVDKFLDEAFMSMNEKKRSEEYYQNHFSWFAKKLDFIFKYCILEYVKPVVKPRIDETIKMMAQKTQGYYPQSVELKNIDEIFRRPQHKMDILRERSTIPKHLKNLEM